MRQLYLIRGLPGSGKSTFAKKIAEVICEADMFFEKDGAYAYDREKLPEAHAWCKEKVKEAMISGLNPIAVANTFVKRWEMDDYLNLANKNYYQVTEVTMSGPVRKNEHKVPDETIVRMRDNWER
jgi:Predicted kinase